MSEENFRIVLVILAVLFGIAFLAICADLMQRHPAIPWFGFGVIATIGLEGLVYGVYRLVKYIRGK